MSHIVFCGVILEKLTARNRGDRTQHRVDRVLGLFLQSSKLGPPHPLTRRTVCPPLCFRGGDTHACGIGGSQFGRDDRHCGNLGIYVLCGAQVR